MRTAGQELEHHVEALRVLEGGDEARAEGVVALGGQRALGDDGTHLLADGTRGAEYAREYSKVSGHLNYPNTGYNTIGFGAFKPFIVLSP